MRNSNFKKIFKEEFKDSLKFMLLGVIVAVAILSTIFTITFLFLKLTGNYIMSYIVAMSSMFILIAVLQSYVLAKEQVELNRKIEEIKNEKNI